MSAAAIDAVNCELLTKVVVFALPFHSIEEPESNPLPFTVNMNAPLPATAEAGDKDTIDGIGLEGGGELLMPEDDPPLQPEITRKRAHRAVIPRLATALGRALPTGTQIENELARFI